MSVASRAARTTVLLALAMVARPAAAVDAPDDRDQALPCRPTIACTAEIVHPGTFEVETGILYRSLAGRERQWTTPTLFKLTVTNWLQLQLASNGYTVMDGGASARYLDNVSPGAKLHLVDQNDLVPAISLSAAVAVPTWGGQLGYTRVVDASFTGYVTKDIGPLHADLNVGANAWGLDASPRSQGFVALALSTSLPPPFGVMAEGYYFSDASPLAARDGGILFALSHSPRRWLVFDFGGDVGLFRETRAYSVFVGMSVVPAVLWR